MTDVEAVLFDLDGTLLRYRRSPAAVLERSFEAVGVEPLFSIDEYVDRFDEFARDHESMADLRSACFATLAAENGHDAALGRDVAAAYAAARDQSNVALLPGAARVLETLSEVARIAIVTNGAADAQRRKVAAVDLDRWVDAVVVAGGDVAPKPAPEPFELALERVGTAPEAAVHVGDSMRTDVRGASAAGLRSILLDAASTDGDRGSSDHGPAYRIDSIAELPAVLRTEGLRLAGETDPIDERQSTGADSPAYGTSS